MAGAIKGITIEISGNTKPLNKALGDAGKKSKDLQSELKDVNKLLKFDPKNTELLAQKQTLLKKAVGETKDKLDALKRAEKEVQQQFKNGDIGEEQYRLLQREIIKAEQDLKGLETQAKESNTAVSKIATSAGQIGDKLTNAGQKMSYLSAAITAGVTVAAKSALEASDSFVKLSDETGLSLSELQELAYVGGQVGVELETVAGAQAKLTKSMNAARGGKGTQADAFAELGISVTDANGNLRDAQTVMGEAFTALNGVGNETERDALAMAIFGKSAMDLNPLIKLGADGLSDMKKKSHELGTVMDDETIKTLDDFGDSLDGFKKTLMVTVGEALTPFFDKLTEIVKKFSEMPEGKKKFVLAILGIIAAIGPLLIILGTLASSLGKIITLFGTVKGAAALAGGAGGVGKFAAALGALAGPAGIIAAVVASLGILCYWIAKSEDNYIHFADTVKMPAGSRYNIENGGMPTDKNNNLGFGDFRALASGGIVTRPTYALVGEAGPEAVVPLNKAGQLGSNITITVTGNQISSDYDVERIGNKLADIISRDNRRLPNRTSIVPL